MEQTNHSYRTNEIVTVTLNPAIDQTVVIPDFAAGQVNRVVETTSQPGGKGVNVAAVLADFGQQVGATGFLGRANDGTFEDLFNAKSITDGFVRIAGQTRTGIKITDPTQHQTTDINFPGQAPTAADLDALLERLNALTSPWVVLAGSIPPGIETTIYRELVAMLKEQGRRVALDTSGDGLQHALAACPDIIKPNIHELEALVGHILSTPEAVIEAAHTLLAQGIALVVVSMGGDGACFVTNEQTVVARPPRVEVQSTVGAGDAMVAGIVAAQLRGLSLAESARLATAFSLDVITHIGTGLSSPDSIARFQEQVAVRIIVGAPVKAS